MSSCEGAAPLAAGAPWAATAPWSVTVASDPQLAATPLVGSAPNSAGSSGWQRQPAHVAAALQNTARCL